MGALTGELLFRVWYHPRAQLAHSGNSYGNAFAAMQKAAKEDVAWFGEDAARAVGDHPYGYHITVDQGWNDVTEQWKKDNPDKPLELP